MIVLDFLSWLKTLYCGMIFSHDAKGEYEMNDEPIVICGRCGKVWSGGLDFDDDDAA